MFHLFVYLLERTVLLKIPNLRQGSDIVHDVKAKKKSSNYSILNSLTEKKFFALSSNKQKACSELTETAFCYFFLAELNLALPVGT